MQRNAEVTRRALAARSVDRAEATAIHAAQASAWERFCATLRRWF